MPNDNRMGWVRELESLEKHEVKTCTRYEIASEKRFVGVMSYGKLFAIGPYSLEPDARGLNKSLIKINGAGFQGHNRSADSIGYYFPAGSVEELLALFSVHYRCRFYNAAQIYGELGPSSTEFRIEASYRYGVVRSNNHNEVLSESEKNWKAGGITEFLDKVRRLKPEHHQRYAQACFQYHLALKEIGVDTEMVFIRLVSSIEILSNSFELSNKDDLAEINEILQLIANSKLDGEVKKDLINTIEVRKTYKKFLRFIEEYCSGYFKGGRFKSRNLKLTKRDLPRILKTIYGARSKYLHEGEPMYLSIYFGPNRSWDIDPSLGMTIDNRHIKGAKKMPYPHFFEGLVRRCLINFLERNMQ